MANLRDIRKRIEAAVNIRKITQTMEKISAVRVLRTNKRLDRTREYARTLKSMAADLFYTSIQEDNSLKDICILHGKGKKHKVGMIVITSNQGMCGGFNHNVIQLADKVYSQFIKVNKKVVLFAVGRKVIQHFRGHGIGLELACNQYSDNITYEDITPLAERLMHSIETEEMDEIFLVYNHMDAPSAWKPVYEALLPCDEFLKEVNRIKTPKLFMCEPDIHDLIKNLLPELVINRLFQAILESIVAEHISRRLAMQQASTSAKDMITEMRNQYHALRKSRITKELNEIMGTVLALQRE